MFKMIRVSVAALALCLLGAQFAGAGYPDRPVTLIVPFGSGGSNDIPARLLSSMMEKKLGQPIVVQNIVGAGGTQGTSQIVAAKPDGYTLGFNPTGPMSLQPHVLKLPYGRDDMDLLGMVSIQPVVLMTGKNAPWKNLDEFVAMARKEPGKYIAGITAKGNLTHVPVLALAKHYGLDLKYVPYRSTPEVMKDMAAGRIHLHADQPVALSRYEVEGLVQFSDEKVDGLDMPSAKDINLPDTFMMWQAVLAPKGLPADVRAKLVETVREVVTSPEFKDEATKVGISARWMSPEDMTATYVKDYEVYGKALKEIFAQ